MSNINCDCECSNCENDNDVLKYAVYDTSRNSPETAQDALYRANSLDAGLDIRSSEHGRVDRNNRQLIQTNMCVEIPENHVGLIWSRSGISSKFGIEVGAGCIDSGYRGEIKVLLYNHTSEDYYVHPGDKIAQLLILPCAILKPKLVDRNELSTPDERSEKGFGSSGI
jgi:dUTP pyrophosphatase